MSVTVKKQYLCGYHCQSCGWFNIEAGEIEAKADMQAEAAELAQRLFQNVKSGVNQRTEYGMPGIKGVCRKCGTKQVWSSHERKTSVAEKALFAMMGVSLVIGAVGMLIYQNLLPVLLGSVLAMALLGVELRMTSRVNKAYRESVCKQVDEELSSVIGWNPYPYVAASDDAADPSDERSVGDDLRGLGQALLPHLRDADGEENGDGEAEDERIEAQQERIADEAEGKDGIKELPKPPQAHPFAREHADKTAAHLEILKRHRQPRHRQIAEDDVIDEHGQKHQQQIFIAGDELGQALALAGGDCACFPVHSSSPPFLCSHALCAGTMRRELSIMSKMPRGSVTECLKCRCD